MKRPKRRPKFLFFKTDSSVANIAELKSKFETVDNKKFIQAYDRDKNAKISWTEFLTAVLVKNKAKPTKVDLLEGLAKIPRDKSGTKDLEEMVKVMDTHGHQTKVPQIETWLRNYKKN